MHTKNKVMESAENQTRQEILDETGYRLQLLFPRLPEEVNDEQSYSSELVRMGDEVGAENVVGREVYDHSFGKLCMGIFVQQDAVRSTSKK